MKRMAMVLLLLLVSTTALAATTIRGKVVAPDGQTPYPEVEVTIDAIKKTVYTDRDGEFYVRNVEPGKLTIRVKTSRSNTTHTIVALEQPVTDVKISAR
jgi:hypothetical protein